MQKNIIVYINPQTFCLQKDTYLNVGAQFLEDLVDLIFETTT